MSKEDYLVLQRVSWRKKPRTDWPERWYAAVRACGGKGVYQPKNDEPFVMAATRYSSVWKKLASGAGGFRDAIGIGEPPFAFGSGLGWRPFSLPESDKDNSALDILEEQMKSLPKEIKLEINL